MKYLLRYHAAVVREDIPSLAAVFKTRIKLAIEQKLGDRPEIFGHPLRRSLKGYWKLRVGDYRVVYRVQQSTVYIIAILHRSIVYNKADSRVGRS